MNAKMHANRQISALADTHIETLQGKCEKYLHVNEHVYSLKGVRAPLSNRTPKKWNENQCL